MLSRNEQMHLARRSRYTFWIQILIPSLKTRIDYTGCWILLGKTAWEKPVESPADISKQCGTRVWIVCLGAFPEQMAKASYVQHGLVLMRLLSSAHAVAWAITGFNDSQQDVTAVSHRSGRQLRHTQSTLKLTMLGGQASIGMQQTQVRPRVCS